jgi:hypothetical protein
MNKMVLHYHFREKTQKTTKLIIVFRNKQHMVWETLLVEHKRLEHNV